MSAISDGGGGARGGTPKKRAARVFDGPRADDARVVRTRAAVVDAARTLFLRNGYAGTTIEEIAALAGITKRTVYNNYAGKEALFMQIVVEAIAYAGEFARGLHEEQAAGITAANLRATLHDLGRRMALVVVSRDVIALRRLLITESREFPALARKYFDRVPGQVLAALASVFEELGRTGVLRVADARSAAAQFAYLVVGELLDRAMLVGTVPPRKHIVARARAGVETFLARYATGSGL